MKIIKENIVTCNIKCLFETNIINQLIFRIKA